MKPRIAVDVQFGSEHLRLLEVAGFEVVVRAEHNETDVSWLRRAEAAGAQMVCSPDNEVGWWAWDRNIKYCRVPGSKRADLVALALRAWKEQ